MTLVIIVWVLWTLLERRELFRGTACVARTGGPVNRSNALRPVASIDLTSSNCEMTSSVNENGKMTLRLEFKSDV